MPERKPLELAVYPPVPPEPHDPWAGSGAEGLGHVMWRLDREREEWLAESKRLSDAELAAEHHAAVLDVYRARVHHDDADWAERLGRMQTMHRFATNPHHDEDNDEGLT